MNELENFGQIQLISVTRNIDYLLSIKGLYPNQHDDWIRTYCPYCFTYNTKNNTYLPLNREYRILGIHPHETKIIKNELINEVSIPEELIDVTTLTLNSSEYYHIYNGINTPSKNRNCLTDYNNTLKTVLKLHF